MGEETEERNINAVKVMTAPLNIIDRNVGKLIDAKIRKKHQTDSRGAPSDGAYHGYIHAFGSIYEFGTNGVKISPIETRKGQTKRHQGNTTRSKEEFDDWCDIAKQEQFRAESYNVMTWNCLTFTKAACEFLGVDFPPEMQTQIDWLKDSFELRSKRAAVGFIGTSFLLYVIVPILVAVILYYYFVYADKIVLKVSSIL